MILENRQFGHKHRAEVLSISYEQFAYEKTSELLDNIEKSLSPFTGRFFKLSGPSCYSGRNMDHSNLKSNSKSGSILWLYDPKNFVFKNQPVHLLL